MRLHGRSKNVNKKSFIGLGRDRTGVARGLFLLCGVVFAVLSFSLCLLLLPICRSTPYYDSGSEDTSEDSLQPLSSKVLSVNLHSKGLGY